MSAETSTWLNTQTLIGFTDQRGHAWHYRADDQGDEPNHYPSAVPVADVASIGSGSRRAAPGASAVAALRATTWAANRSSRDRLPTREISQVTSRTSPARTRAPF